MASALIETARLIIRPFTDADGDAAFTWFGDPEVMRYTPSGPDASPAKTRARVATYVEHQATHGFSKWVIRERRSGICIGDSGLMMLPQEKCGNDVELGFRLARSHWGKGFATEAANAWTAFAFQQARLSCITAFAHPANAASLRVLAKAGFAATGTSLVMGMEAQTFELESALWATRSDNPPLQWTGAAERLL